MPPDYTGEKHIVMTKQLPNRGDQEWVESEDRPGPDPSPPFHGCTECIHVVYVETYTTLLKNELVASVPFSDGCAGEAAMAVHVGPYDQLHGAHAAIHDWAKSHRRTLAGSSWEIDGDWSDDPSKLETTVMYLLA